MRTCDCGSHDTIPCPWVLGRTLLVITLRYLQLARILADLARDLTISEDKADDTYQYRKIPLESHR
jgi:hypothetical protein